MNPVNDFIQEYGKEPTEKTAFGGRIGEGILTGLGTAVAAGSIALGGLAASKIYNAATKARDFRSMMKYNPDLQEHHDRDPRMFNRMFTSLRDMNPSFSADPLVAGSYMRRMADNPLTMGGVLTESLATRDKFQNLTDQFVNTGAAAAGKAIGSYRQDPRK